MTDPRNPYRPPTAPVADQVEEPVAAAGEAFIPNGRRVPAGRGAAWIGDAWHLLRAKPGKWLLVMLLFLLIYLVTLFIPFSGIVNALLVPFIAAGIVVAADRQRRTGTFEPGAIFEGFRDHPKSLLAVSGMALLSMVVLFVSVAIASGADAAMRTVLNVGSGPDAELILSPGYAFAMLIYLALALPITAATYLAAPLIVLHGLPAGTAMKMSFVASFKNVLSGLVFGVCAMGLFVLALIPLGLGLLVLIPVLILTNYTMYRDFFIETSSP